MSAFRQSPQLRIASLTRGSSQESAGASQCRIRAIMALGLSGAIGYLDLRDPAYSGSKLGEASVFSRIPSTTAGFLSIDDNAARARLLRVLGHGARSPAARQGEP